MAPGARTWRISFTEERRRPWRGRLGLGGAGAAGTIRRGSPASSASGRQPAACPAGLRLLLACGGCGSGCGCSKRLGVAALYRQAARRARAPLEDTCPRCPVTNDARERGRRRRRSRRNYARARTSTRSRGNTTSTVRHALCRWLDRASARCGELRRRRAPGGVKGGGDEDCGEGWHAWAG